MGTIGIQELLFLLFFSPLVVSTPQGKMLGVTVTVQRLVAAHNAEIRVERWEAERAEQEAEGQKLNRQQKQP